MKNKTKNYTLSVEMRNTQEEILSRCPNALCTLHYSNGFNYHKPYRVYKHIGMFTINSLAKRYNIDYKRDNVIVLSVYKQLWHMELEKTSNNLKFNELYLFNLPNGGNVKSIANIYNRTSIEYPNICDFAQIDDFNDIRKSNNSIIYIVIQEKQYCCEPSNRKINKYMSTFDCGYTFNQYNQIKNKLDKSGYNITIYQDKLIERLKTFHDKAKVENFKKEANYLYNTHINNINIFKSYVSTILNNCKPTENQEVNILGDVLYSLNRYISYVNEIKSVKDSTELKWYDTRCNDVAKILSFKCYRVNLYDQGMRIIW